MKKYFIIQIKRGRRNSEGYSILVETYNSYTCGIIGQIVEDGYFDCIEDIYDVGYIKEIPEKEYKQLYEKAHKKWEYGCMIGEKVFSEEDYNHAKQLSYKNEEESVIGFEYLGQWITNPFLEPSGRFEFKDIFAMYDYYSKNIDGQYEVGFKENVYNFIIKILNNIQEETTMIDAIAAWITEVGLINTTNGSRYVTFEDIADTFKISEIWVKEHAEEIKDCMDYDVVSECNIEDDSFGMMFYLHYCCEHCGRYNEGNRSYENCSSCECWCDSMEEES